jgi:hypothetical protein
MNGFAGGAGQLHVETLVVLCRLTCLWLIGTAWRVLNRIILGAFAAVDALVGMGTEERGCGLIRLVDYLLLKRSTAR